MISPLLASRSTELAGSSRAAVARRRNRSRAGLRRLDSTGQPPVADRAARQVPVKRGAALLQEGRGGPPSASALAQARRRASSTSAVDAGGGAERSSASLCAAMVSGARPAISAAQSSATSRAPSPVHEAEAMQLLAGRRWRGQQHGPASSASRPRGQALDRPLVDRQTQPGGRDPEHAGGRRHPQVARRRQLHPRAQRRAVDGGDAHGRQLPEAPQHLAQRGREPAVLHAAQVGAGTERRRRAGEHQHPGAAGRAASCSVRAARSVA